MPCGYPFAESTDECDENPCLTCDQVNYCDGWEAQFCCDRCRYDGREDCDNCDPMDL